MPPAVDAPQFVLVDDQRALDLCATRIGEELRENRHLYLDTEFESRASGTRLCLLQLSAGSTIYLIDALANVNFETLARTLDLPNVTWVVHAGLSDVDLVTRVCGLPAPAALLDTQVAFALLGPEASVSLAYLLYRTLGVRIGKTHQADDWTRRPLPASQLAYAAGDVRYLPEAAQLLTERLGALARYEIALAASREAASDDRPPQTPLTLASFRGAFQLDSESQAALRWLVEWHSGLDAHARKDAPDNKTLLAIAARGPATVGDLERIKGTSRDFVRRFGKAVIDGVGRARRSASADEFVAIEPPPYASFPDLRLEGWLAHLRSEVSSEVGVAPDFVLPRRVLSALERGYRCGAIDGVVSALAGYRRPLLEASVRRFCERTPPPV